MPWLPSDFVHPQRVELPTGQHLRPIRAADVDLDMVAVMGSRDRLWSIFGPAWGWPPASLTREQDREDLARHAAEMTALESFNYAIFDADETALLGCVYIDAPGKPGADADVSLGGSSTASSTPKSSEPWSSSCRYGSGRCGRSEHRVTSVAISPGSSGWRPDRLEPASRSPYCGLDIALGTACGCALWSLRASAAGGG